MAVLFSKYMSATFQSASIAAENINSDRLYLIDCETGAMGQGLLVETAVTLRDEGKSAKEIADTIQALLKKTATYIVVDSLEYLKRGGRISKSAALLGGLMKVHPVLQVIADGAKPIDKVKGKKSANAWEQIRKEFLLKWQERNRKVREQNLEKNSCWIYIEIVKKNKAKLFQV